MNLNHMSVSRKLWLMILGLAAVMLFLLAGLLAYVYCLNDQVAFVVQVIESRIPPCAALPSIGRTDNG